MPAFDWTVDEVKFEDCLGFSLLRFDKWVVNCCMYFFDNWDEKMIQILYKSMHK